MNEELLNDLDFIKAILVKATVAAAPPDHGRTPSVSSVYEMAYRINQALRFVEALRTRVERGEE